MGSFTIHKNFLTILNNYQTRDIFIFWQNITKTEKCGKYVSYLVYCTPILIKNKRPRLVYYIYFFIIIVRLYVYNNITYVHYKF